MVRKSGNQELRQTSKSLDPTRSVFLKDSGRLAAPAFKLKMSWTGWRGKMKGRRHLNCVFCYREEISQFNSRKRAYRPGKDIVSIICSACIQKYLQFPQNKFLEAYKAAIEKGFTEKASLITQFIHEKDECHDSEARQTGPDMVRKRLVRTARPTRNSIRA